MLANAERRFHYKRCAFVSLTIELSENQAPYFSTGLIFE
jgi:hypothetical protein